jgi:hypothetical protein
VSIVAVICGTPFLKLASKASKERSPALAVIAALPGRQAQGTAEGRASCTPGGPVGEMFCPQLEKKGAASAKPTPNGRGR